MGFLEDEYGEVLLDEFDEPMEDEEDGVNLWVKSLSVGTVFSEAILNDTPIAIVSIEDMVVVVDFSVPVITSTTPVNLTIENMVVSQLFSSAEINDQLPVDLTIENMIVTPVFSEVNLRRITGLITISITAET